MATERSKPVQPPKPKRARRVVGKAGQGLPSPDLGILVSPPLPTFEWEAGIDPDALGVACRVDPTTGAIIPLA